MTIPIPASLVIHLPAVGGDGSSVATPPRGRNHLSYRAALVAARLQHTRTTEDMTAVLLDAYPAVGHASAFSLANYMMHVRRGVHATDAESDSMYNAIRMWTCLGLYGDEMEAISEEWFMMREIMRSVGLQSRHI
jgi:hypothetical protein